MFLILDKNLKSLHDNRDLTVMVNFRNDDKSVASLIRKQVFPRSDVKFILDVL